MMVVGLTGGIGSGKSTVAQLFAERNVSVIDTDVISHQLTQTNGAAITAIRDLFGVDYIDAQGAMDRGKMRERIFADASAKQQLQQILYPLIYQQCATQLASLQHQPYVLLVVPLLAENPLFQNLVQRVLVVDCAEQAQLTRVMQRSKLNEQQVFAIMQQQASREARLQLADDVITNDAGIENLICQVSDLHNKYLMLHKQ